MMFQPCFLAVEMKERRVAYFSQLVPFRQLEPTAYYQEIQRPQGIVHQICAGIENDGVRRVRVGVFRSAEAGPGGQAEGRILQALAPHLKCFGRVATRIQGSGLAEAIAFDALDRMREGVILLDEQGRVLHINRQAEAVLGADDRLQVTGRRLISRSPHQATALDRLIARANAGLGGGQLAIGRRNGRPSFLVTALPIGRRSEWPQEEPPSAMLLIHDLDRVAEDTATLLAEIYDLSPRQARIAVDVASGIGLPAIARNLGVSQHTARSHLQQVFRKTGLANQIALAAMVGRLESAPHADESEF